MKKKTFRIVSMAIVFVMLSAGFAFAASVPGDVPGTAYETAVLALIEAGAVTGDIDGLFHPANSLTRAQACTILVRAMNPPSADLVGTITQTVPSAGFPDLSGYGWAEPYIDYAARHDITKGYTDGSFQPGRSVTSNEMLTFVLRAAGYTDAVVGSDWPNAHIAKAREIGILRGIDDPPITATKEIAAQMVYNLLPELKAQAAPETVPGDTNGSAAKPPDKELESIDGLIFATGKFNNNMSDYAGLKISPRAEIFTYGLQKNYKKDMPIPPQERVMRADTIHKFKFAETPCFYRLENGQITFMLLPMDSGFSGYIYGVINGSNPILNGNGDAVNSLNTLVAGQQVSWLTRNADIGKTESFKDHLKGEVYEIRASSGTIREDPKTVRDAPDVRERFKELTNDEGTLTGWNNKVVEYEDRYVTLTNASINLIPISDSAVIYVLNEDGKSYRVGGKGDIRKDYYIRAYSISEDREIAAIVVLSKNKF